MQELYTTALALHKFFVVFFGVLLLIYLFLAHYGNGENAYIKRIRLFLPFFYTILACLIFTGTLLLPILEFKFNYKIIFMIVAVIAIIALSAIGYKRLKMAYFTKDFDLYKKQISKIIIVNLILILIASFI
ncbi:MAG: hypothetical protein J6W17_03415 [Campylobacter sp.]|nr:hypothetical protein [Campylobacter sp.]